MTNPKSKIPNPKFIFALPEGVVKMLEQDKSVSTYAMIIFILVSIYFVVACVVA